MNLAIDIGNTLTKIAVIDSGQIMDTFQCEDISVDYLTENIFSAYPGIKNGIMISTRDKNREVEEFLKDKLRNFIIFDYNTPVPITNLYETPTTLGSDRLAAAVGAFSIDSEANSLIVDFGTAITIDFVTAKGEFLGGNISPGANTRFRALHQFTRKLPLRELTDETQLLAKNSYSAIESGVINGIVYEIEGYIADLSAEYGDFKIIFTGGDGNFFVKRFKKPIFATRDLVVYGLNKILEYNAQ